MNFLKFRDEKEKEKKNTIKQTNKQTFGKVWEPK